VSNVDVNDVTVDIAPVAIGFSADVDDDDEDDSSLLILLPLLLLLLFSTLYLYRLP
jgi:hypothetical protein